MALTDFDPVETHPLDLLLVEGDHFQELQKPHESTTWKEESGAYEAKKLATISLVFLSKQENITGNLLQGQISVHHDNFQVSTWIHQSGSNKIPTTLAHDSFNIQISRVNDLESPLNFTRLVHVPNIQLLLLDSTWQSGDMSGGVSCRERYEKNDGSVSWNNRGKCFHEKITRVKKGSAKNVDPKWWGRRHFDRVYTVAL